jgi:hypothetical protein
LARVALAALAVANTAFAEETTQTTQTANAAPAATSANATPQSEANANPEATGTWAKLKKNFGVDLNSFWSGPGIGQPLSQSPGMQGTPSDTGLNFFNLISVKWKFSDNLAFDVQLRNQIVHTADPEFRWQGQRFGVSGKLLKGENWSLSGAINTDLPIPGLMGQINSERTLLFNPGAFTFFNYKPKGSRWSVFALLTPRFFVYRDRDARSVQDEASGLAAGEKPEYFLIANPSINYQVSETVGVRFGTTLDFTKNVAWEGPRRNYMPFELGVTWDVTDSISIYPYILGSSPLDDALRRQQGSDRQWYQTVSVGTWISGTLF